MRRFRIVRRLFEKAHKDLKLSSWLEKSYLYWLEDISFCIFICGDLRVNVFQFLLCGDGALNKLSIHSLLCIREQRVEEAYIPGQRTDLE